MNTGSSPLARGLLRGVGRGARSVGIIPARAGFTIARWPWPRARPDHPRSRGGLLLIRGASGARSGIIPARAGFTFAFAPAWLTSRDHPRSRGVYSTSRMPPGAQSGSSPLARGLLLIAAVVCVVIGIIPARAGFTHRRHRRRRRPRDHPRSRGVYRRRSSTPGSGGGSSPLARGLHYQVVDWVTDERIIPARAGFTPVHGACERAHADHPRSRGVYPPPTVTAAVTVGSSPLARGLPPGSADDRSGIRIIPARAGFTSPSAGRPAPPTDHPRSRGVYWSRPTPPRRIRGSSPLARGLLADLSGGLGGGGIIPARAGFTG